MIRINLLPHREAKRKQKKTAFAVLMALGGIIGAVVVLGVGGYNATQIAIQEEKNALLTNANTELDKKIVAIATLKQEIEALKARQQAVEDLQGDRNQPVYLLDELVKQTPSGVYLKSFKQDGQRVVLNGYAQSNERVSELLRNLSNNSPWLERPDLIEIRSTGMGQGREARKVYDFTVNVGVKRPRDKEAAAHAAETGAGADKNAAKGPAAAEVKPSAPAKAP